jgi:hypothetical protein
VEVSLGEILSGEDLLKKLKIRGMRRISRVLIFRDNLV